MDIRHPTNGIVPCLGLARFGYDHVQRLFRSGRSSHFQSLPAATCRPQISHSTLVKSFRVCHRLDSLQRLAYLREHANQKEKCLVVFEVTPSRLEITIPPCDHHDLCLIYRRQVETVQLQQEGLMLREVASRLKVLVDIVHKILEVRREYNGCTGPLKKRMGSPKFSAVMTSCT